MQRPQRNKEYKEERGQVNFKTYVFKSYPSKIYVHLKSHKCKPKKIKIEATWVRDIQLSTSNWGDFVLQVNSDNRCWIRGIDKRSMLGYFLQLFCQTYFLALDYTSVENSTGMFSHSRGGILNLLYCDIFYFLISPMPFYLTFLKCRFLVKGRVYEDR